MRKMILTSIAILAASSAFAELNCYKITEITVHERGVQIKGPNVAKGMSALILNEKLGDSTYRRNVEAAKYAMAHNIKFCMNNNDSETIILRK